MIWLLARTEHMILKWLAGDFFPCAGMLFINTRSLDTAENLHCMMMESTSGWKRFW